MKYYTKRKKRKYIPIIVISIALVIIFNSVIVFLDNKVMPSLDRVAEMTVRSRVLNIINSNSIKLFADEFNYNEMIKIEKDNDGNITLIQADTVKLNYLASKLSIQCNEELQNLEDIKIKIPLGWFTDNSIYYNLGPQMAIRVEDVGNINANYESGFESAGINQTRHRIYLNVESKVRVILPFKTNEVEIVTKVPVSDTIIVGKIPETAIDFKQSN
ncbi:sporulation protein YunB [Clostridium botulinum]|uniref:Sporulation protein YunB n=1 Tax=Clostridium botulinum (strain Eklund 17B / Type B) TaxID=935198 RepID=B2TML3_CLOBB|nr:MULTISPECIES: sporulation protein YunB [Clostridium]ACD23800.1 sporulation protein YunB [Clostridium botulinum B str. Eklund 17B (NRP)]AIY79580.1 sporulation protein YunB [Clostridium botulinum 202F]KAI3348358.1 sporulation protein YunB [Clostridium botulinum]KFX58931.1 sporulation protein [Clostridium botulinum]KON12816.1 sporulation protein [Clostridium botulinum]